MRNELPSIAKHASKHGILPLKKFGQNFIFDQTLCDKIVRASGLQSGDIVLEIGPGSGGLTRSILSCKPKSLTVIETDNRCMALLAELREAYSNLRIIAGDALKITLNSLEHNNRDKLFIIANLPYHIGTELVIRWLKEAHLINSMTLMLQKEVADRIRAEPGSKTYGRLSVICQLICYIEKCFDVAPQAFYPPPKVFSTIIKLTPLAQQPNNALIERVEQITKLAFGERRKMLRSSLKKLTPNIDQVLTNLSINPMARAEELSVEDYKRIATEVLGISK